MTEKRVMWPVAAAMGILLLAMVAAMPGQGGEDLRPSQPLLQDYYSGTVTIQGSPAPAGTQLVACVDSCDTYQSAAVAIGESGAYTGLTVAPTDPRMIGRDVTFHIVNEHGSIQSDGTAEFFGVYDLYQGDLTFSSPIPAPAPPTATPQPTATPVPPTPTPTPEPTATPEPTPEPTPTPVPTATPEPTPTAILPITGDTAVTRIPPLVIAGGAILAALGIALLIIGSRRNRKEPTTAN